MPDKGARLMLDGFPFVLLARPQCEPASSTGAVRCRVDGRIALNQPRGSYLHVSMRLRRFPVMLRPEASGSGAGSGFRAVSLQNPASAVSELRVRVHGFPARARLGKLGRDGVRVELLGLESRGTRWVGPVLPGAGACDFTRPPVLLLGRGGRLAASGDSVCRVNGAGLAVKRLGRKGAVPLEPVKRMRLSVDRNASLLLRFQGKNTRVIFRGRPRGGDVLLRMGPGKKIGQFN